LGALVSAKSSQEAAEISKEPGGFGTVEEAFDVASMEVKDYLGHAESAPVVIDPEFRSTLLSKSKIWTIKGYALCPKNDQKMYKWVVIMNYHDMQEWDFLDKTITPVSRQIED
jgi:hypothetical protein